ncbi:MAG TPA: hypothetical protein DHV59_00860 [Oxalobacteraceae bacterium]|nr:hypothetical protein [Oxalobacteraceae bacterium]
MEQATSAFDQLMIFNKMCIFLMTKTLHIVSEFIIVNGINTVNGPFGQPLSLLLSNKNTCKNNGMPVKKP